MSRPRRCITGLPPVPIRPVFKMSMFQAYHDLRDRLHAEMIRHGLEPSNPPLITPMRYTTPIILPLYRFEE
jgi:hypothetical protein